MNTRRTLLAATAAAASVYSPLPLTAGVALRLPGQPPRTTQFPNAVFHTHNGKSVRFYDDLVKGRLVIFNMMLRACTDGSCPPMTANLCAVQQALGARVGRDVNMYSITLQPEFDTPRSLKAYADMFGVKPGWAFLAGSPQDTQSVRHALGFYDLDAQVDGDISQHTGMLRIGNDRYDRWIMMPALSRPRSIVDAVERLTI